MRTCKTILSLFLTIVLTMSLASCGVITSPDGPTEVITNSDPAPQEVPEVQPAEEPVEEPAADPVQIRVAALNGPTAMGLVHLMHETETRQNYLFTLAGSADVVTPGLVKEGLDVACVPANLASVLYNKTEGGIVCLAVNTLGVLYIVENGEEVQSMADLKGKTIVSAGKGSTPEYGLRYLLSENGIDPDKDVTIDWKSEHAECVAALASGAATIAMLPQPFVTVAQTKIEGLRTALDLTAEWDALDNGSAMITGVAVARRAFVEEHPEAIKGFLEEYAASAAWANENPADAADLIAKSGIIESAAVAEKALPHCNIVCLTGQEMYEKLSGYLQVLGEAAPEAVGGEVPQDDFYFGLS